MTTLVEIKAIFLSLIRKRYLYIRNGEICMYLKPWQSSQLATEMTFNNNFGVKGTTSRFVHLEKFSLNFSVSSFVIRVNLLHP